VIRVLLVDDHGLFRAGVRSELEGQVDLVGEAESVADAVTKVRELQPEVVLLDVHLPDGTGGDVIAQTAGTAAKFLALSVSDDPDDVIAVIRAGARGYVTKTISSTDLADAVRRVHDGDAVFSPRLAGFVLDAFSGAPGAGSAGARRTRARRGSRLADAARARGPAAHRAGLSLQGDRAAAGHLGEDRGGPCLRSPAQAAAFYASRADAVGVGAVGASELGERPLVD
jgi:DNA-binding NarL/FixJ family response regulator